MPAIDTLVDAARRLTARERPRLAHTLIRGSDGRPSEAIAEGRADDELGMAKAGTGEVGIDGVLPDGRTLRVKSKVAGAHADGATHVTLSPRTLSRADALLIVSVDDERSDVIHAIGPVPVSALHGRRGRYYVSDVVRAMADRVPGAAPQEDPRGARSRPDPVPGPALAHSRTAMIAPTGH